MTKLSGEYSLILADPPYQDEKADGVLQKLAASSLVGPESSYRVRAFEAEDAAGGSWPASVGDEPAARRHGHSPSIVQEAASGHRHVPRPVRSGHERPSRHRPPRRVACSIASSWPSSTWKTTTSSSRPTSAWRSSAKRCATCRASAVEPFRGLTVAFAREQGRNGAGARNPRHDRLRDGVRHGADEQEDGAGDRSRSTSWRAWSRCSSAARASVRWRAWATTLPTWCRRMSPTRCARRFSASRDRPREELSHRHPLSHRSSGRAGRGRQEAAHRRPRRHRPAPPARP